MKHTPTTLVLKILLISHAIYFVKLGIKPSGYILLGCFGLFLIPKVSAKIDQVFEKIVGFLGKSLFQVMLSISYVVVFIPLSLFKSRAKTSKSTFIKIDSSEIDFKRPW